MKSPQAYIQIQQTNSKGEIFRHEGAIEMDTFRKLLGDGQAKVTLSESFGDKSYGNGVETFISIQLTCDQDVEVMNDALVQINRFINERLPTIHSEALAVWKRDEPLNRDIIGNQ